MAKTLAEMRAEAAAGKAPLQSVTRTVTLVEGQHLLDRSYQLNQELLDVLVAAELEQADEVSDSARESKARVRKASQGAHPPRVDEIKAEQADLVRQLAEHQVDIVLEGSSGAWHRYKVAHPPRIEGPEANVDARYTRGSCNADDLFSDLRDFVTSFNGESVGPGDWDTFLAERICYADRLGLVPAVVEMFEESVSRVPKSPTSSPTTPSSGTD